MRLEPRTTEPGLWVNPAWQEGTAGTFAVVIGVSRYTHLDGGDTPAEDLGELWLEEARGLGQLRVSALTAYRVFRWLAEDYRMDGAPLARCWLLLAPTHEEQAAQAGITAHLTAPTFANCHLALRCWRQAMQRLPQAAKQASRALFFFSGHGLEVHQEQQILLPADYLAPPVPSWNDAISTQNLKHGLSSLEVPYRFFFLDACRNDFPRLRGKRVVGADILNEDEAALSYRGIRVAALLYATSSGLQAWQQPDPQRGISLFGQALLDGLAGKSDLELEPHGDLWSVTFTKLQGFVEDRVVQLLHEAHAEAEQPVTPSGIIREADVTLLDGAAVQAARPELAETARLASSERLRLAGLPSALQRAARLTHRLRGAFTVGRAVECNLPYDLVANDWGVAHDLFGSEGVTPAWMNLKLYALHDRYQLGNLSALTLHKLERDDRTRHYRLEVSLSHHDHSGHWLQIVDQAGTAHGVVLPADQNEQPRYVLEFDATFDAGSGRHISRLQAYLSSDSPGRLGAAAELWQCYRTADVAEAVRAFEQSAVYDMLDEVGLLAGDPRDLRELEQIVRDKLASPLAAVVAALILLRADRLDLLHDWLRNLARWFATRPDGPVLWAEQVLRQPVEPPQAIAEAAGFLTLLLKRGLPYTSAGLAYAAGLGDRLARSMQYIPLSIHAELAQVRERLSAALVYFRPGGLFTSYAGFAADTNPLDLIGPAPDEPPPAPASGPFAGPSTADKGQNPQVILEEDAVIIDGVRVPRRRRND